MTTKVVKNINFKHRLKFIENNRSHLNSYCLYKNYLALIVLHVCHLK